MQKGLSQPYQVVSGKDMPVIEEGITYGLGKKFQEYEGSAWYWTDKIYRRDI